MIIIISHSIYCNAVPLSYVYNKKYMAPWWFALQIVIHANFHCKYKANAGRAGGINVEEP